MKYKEIPSELTIQKLLATSFESPSANRKVYNWASNILPHIHFLENERIKLVKKYGIKDNKNGFFVPKSKYPEFWNEFKNILEMDIEGTIEDCPIKEDWFDDDKCSYPKEKELWITPKEIGSILSK